jgi:PAS domain S-box-containing protein
MTPDQLAVHPNPIWVCDPAEMRIFACNDAACRFLGQARSSITGLAPANLGLSAPDGLIHVDFPGGPSVFANLSRTDIDWDGAPARLLILVLHPKPLAEADEGSPVRFPQQMKRLMLLSGYGFIGTEAQTGQIQMTPQLQVIFGLGEGARAGRVADMMPNVHADDLPRYLADRKAASDTGSLSETVVRVLQPNGNIHHVKVSVGTDADSGGREFGMAQDVTETVTLSERGVRMEALLQLTSDLARLGGWQRDMATEITDFTPGINQIFGLPEGSFDPDALLRCYDGAGRADIVQANERVVRERRQVDGEYAITALDGARKWVRVMQRPVLAQNGRVTAVVGAIQDITELYHEQERLHAVIDVAADAVYEFDPNRTSTVYSAGIRDTFGHDWVGEQHHATPWELALHPDDRDRIVAEFRAFCAGPDLRWKSVYRVLRGDGRVAHVRDKAVAVRNEAGALLRVIGSIEDVTQQHRSEERLKQTQRLEVIGELTGGIAHDFNNLLTVILGNADLLDADVRLDGGSRDRVSVILRAAERAADLTAGLLSFAGQQPLAPRTLDIGVALAEVRRLLDRTLPANISLQVLTPPGLWLVEADPAHLNAAILNLAVNARDAMPQGGKLLIECSNEHLDETFADSNPDPQAGDFVRIAVTDTGTGIPPDVLNRVFEPFFTTKARGAGTGMGLSMVRGFAEQSGGHAKIQTEPGRGTTVSLYLPCSAAEQADAVVEPVASVLQGNGEHVLVVEDNELLLPHVTQMITTLGYRASAALNADAALAILAKEELIDLLFTDVILPGEINGAKLAKLAQAQRPGLKVLFTSGYTEDAIFHDGRLDPGVQLLSKPYRRHELARKLRQILEGKG